MPLTLTHRRSRCRVCASCSARIFLSIFTYVITLGRVSLLVQLSTGLKQVKPGWYWVRQSFFCLLNDVFGSCISTTLKPSANARWRAALCDSWHLSTFAWKILIVTGWWRSCLSLFIWRYGLVVSSGVIRLVSDSPAGGCLEGSGEELERP